jgi:hypothetical protein
VTKIYIPDPDVAASGWLNFPEECLWIKYPDHTAILPCPNLEALYRGKRPQTQAERMLVANRPWLRILLDYALGEYVVTISADSPLPEWDAAWLQTVLPRS